VVRLASVIRGYPHNSGTSHISKTVVSTDDEKILGISEKYGADVIVRPDTLATDESSSESVIHHAVDHLMSIGEVFDFFVLLQPTSPLRNENDIDMAIDMYVVKDATSLLSVVKAKHHPFKMIIKSENDTISSVNGWDKISMPRQSLPPAMIINGAIYICSVLEFMKTRNLYAMPMALYEMDDMSSIDIDTYSDFNEAEQLMNKYLLSAASNGLGDI